jgi:class 3 adenylate cyclase
MGCSGAFTAIGDTVNVASRCKTQQRNLAASS